MHTLIAVGQASGYAGKQTAQGDPTTISAIRNRAIGSTPALRVASSAALKLVDGPAGTWVTGHERGDVALWDARTGELLDTWPLDGRASWIRVDGNTLYAASDLGDTLVVDLGVLVRDECELLREVWKDVPTVWEAGRAVRRAPSASHRSAVGSKQAP